MLTAIALIALGIGIIYGIVKIRSARAAGDAAAAKKYQISVVGLLIVLAILLVSQLLMS